MSARLIVAVLVMLVYSVVGFAKEEVHTTQVGDVEVKIFIPADAKVLRGVIVHAANYQLKADDRWAEFCRQLQFAHVAMNIPNVQKATNRGSKLYQALHDGLKQAAEKSGHRELVNLPMVGTEHSAGGLVTGVLLRHPDRTLTNCVDCGWVMDQEKLSPEAARVPALFTMGAVPDAFQMLPSIDKFYLPARRSGLPWGLGVQWGCAHDFANAATLMLPWIQGVCQMRLPAEVNAVDGPVALREIKQADGWLGDRRTTDGNFARIASWKDYEYDKLGAVWLPNRETAYVWRAWHSKDAPLTVEAATVDGKNKMPPWNPKKSRDLMIAPDQDVTLSVTIKEGTNLKKIEFYDGDVLLGEATNRPWQFSWKNPARGFHAVFAQWQTADDKIGVTNPALIIVRQSSK